MSTTVVFIGLGNMGGPMAAALVKAGPRVRGYDLAAAPVQDRRRPPPPRTP
ncbi:NAD(P)-binding domain-containing protein [Streptomyces violaceus]|uniref:NAD(P)-binding domain-containing protein n=1 Tax=Streptomyces violaceus TaxID=1936 RepID=UPI002E1F233A|nr:NAD(P)-binding domain-containing protein [Streptomyces violaceus]